MQSSSPCDAMSPSARRRGITVQVSATIVEVREGSTDSSVSQASLTNITPGLTVLCLQESGGAKDGASALPDSSAVPPVMC